MIERRNRNRRKQQHFVYLFDVRTKIQDSGAKTSLVSCLLFLGSLLHHEESFGRLVLLGYDVTTFRPVTYQRNSLLRPSMEVSSRG